jgi:hypothetical protein
MPVAELLIEEIKTLPANRMAEVLDFVEFIKHKEARNAKENVTDDSWFERGEECPICAAHRDPVTGEERFNAETAAAIREGRAMLRGEIPAKWYNSLEEMLVDLDSDD